MIIDDCSKKVQPFKDNKILKDIHCIRRGAKIDYICSMIMDYSCRNSDFEIFTGNVIIADPPVYYKCCKRSKIVNDISYFYDE